MISQTPTGHLQQRIQFNILLITDKRSQTSPLIPFGPPALSPARPQPPRPPFCVQALDLWTQVLLHCCPLPLKRPLPKHQAPCGTRHFLKLHSMDLNAGCVFCSLLLGNLV